MIIPNDMGSEFDDDQGTVTEVELEQKLGRPRLYRVMMHNDDYTTRDFVVFVLRNVFLLSEANAVQVMLHVHHNGVGIAGVYTREIAETKIQTVEQMAIEEEFPLRLTMEPEQESADA